MRPGTEFFATVAEALAEIRQGRIVVVCDEAAREGRCDLVMAADSVTAEAVNFMVREARGLVCLALDHDGCERLGLQPIPGRGSNPDATAFMTTIEAASGVSTGISAADRARTIQVAADPDAGPADIVSPGHVIPVRAREGGLLTGPGHAEAAVDLARLSGCGSAAVFCGAMDDDGAMASVPEMARFCHDHGLKMVTHGQLVSYRRELEPRLERVAESLVPTPFGEFRVLVYRSGRDGREHVAIVKGQVDGADQVLFHVHDESFADDVLEVLERSAAARLRGAMSMVEQAGRGVVVYLSRGGRGILAAGGDGGDRPEGRDLSARILADLGVGSVCLVGADQAEADLLRAEGVRVVGRSALPMARSDLDEIYLYGVPLN